MLKRIICRLWGHDWLTVKTPAHCMTMEWADGTVCTYPEKDMVQERCQRCKLTREV